MGLPVVHVEVIGTDPAALRDYYGALFGWEFDTSGEVSGEVSVPDDYGFTDGNVTDDGLGVPGGVGVDPATRRMRCSTSPCPTWRPPSGRPRSSAVAGCWGRRGLPPVWSSASSPTPRGRWWGSLRSREPGARPRRRMG